MRQRIPPALLSRSSGPVEAGKAAAAKAVDWFTDVDRPLRIARQIQAGTVWINDWAIVYDEIEDGRLQAKRFGTLERRVRDRRFRRIPDPHP